MTGPPTDAIHGVNRLTRTSCPLSPCLSALFKKISTPSDRHRGMTFRPPWAFCVLKSFQKTSSPQLRLLVFLKLRGSIEDKFPCRYFGERVVVQFTLRRKKGTEKLAPVSCAHAVMGGFQQKRTASTGVDAAETVRFSWKVVDSQGQSLSFRKSTVVASIRVRGG